MSAFYFSIQFCFLLIIVCNIKPCDVICGDKTFRLSPMHSNLQPVELPLRQLNVSSRTSCATKFYNDFVCTTFFFKDYNFCSTFNSSLRSMSYVMDNGTAAYEAFSGVPADCYDVMLSDGNTGGLFTIIPRDSGAPINVFCELGGWLVIQRRTDGSEDFYRTWNEYRDGFGNLTNEFWLGNTNIHRITSQGHYELRIDMEDFEGNSAYAIYKEFAVASVNDHFRLSLGLYSGNAGDSLGVHSGEKFSTKDWDLDNNAVDSCALKYHGAWWYGSCHASNLNGLYLRGPHESYADGVEWNTWKGYQYSLKRTVMKIRPMQF